MNTVLLVALCLGAGSEGIEKFIDLKDSVRRDPEPEEITRGRHYINSDERRHDLFYDAMADKGGMFVGVGSNQNYVLAGWAKPEVMVVVDFDQVIIDLHEVFAIVLKNTTTPEAFIDAWRPKSRARGIAWIREALPRGEKRKRLIEVFKEYRDNAKWGVQMMFDRMGEQGQKTYLDDPEQFAFVKRMVEEDRVLYIRGDFTGRRTLADVAKLSRDTGLPVRVLYLSNVEQYITWNKGNYRENMRGLPFDDESVVLRTYGFGEERAADHNYCYYVQPGLDFAKWLSDTDIRSVRGLLRSGQRTDIKGFYRLGVPARSARAGTASSDKPL